MTITLRNTKGSALTYSELDGNFSDLDERLDAINDVQYAAPTTGAEITVTAGVKNLIIEPAATIAALTVNFPASPADEDKFSMCSTEIVTTLTLAGGGNTINGGLAAFIANGFATYIYNTAQTSWYRIG